MKRIIDHIEADSLSKFSESAFKILNGKREQIVENEKVEAGLTFFKEESDCEEDDGNYDEEDPNYDVEIDPEEYSDDDISDLESIVWDDDTMQDADEDVDFEDSDLDLTYEQMVYTLEHFEELDELSKKTLIKYVAKSSADVQHQKERAAKARNASQELANAEYANRTQTSRNSSAKYNRHQHDSVFDHPEVKDAVRKASAAIEKDASRRQNNREYGQYRAFKKLTKEEIEHLEELSKKTLGSYVKKASDDYAQNSYDLGKAREKHDNDYNNVNRAQHGASHEVKKGLSDIQNKMQDDQNKKESNLRHKMIKRSKGISTAAKKLTKEEIEHLEELSKGALARYKLKATDDGNKQADRMFSNKDKTKKAQNDTMRKWINREKGLNNAEKKLNEKD